MSWCYCCGLALYDKEKIPHLHIPPGGHICRSCNEDPAIRKYNPETHTRDGYERDKVNIDYSINVNGSNRTPLKDCRQCHHQLPCMGCPTEMKTVPNQEMIQGSLFM